MNRWSLIPRAPCASTPRAPPGSPPCLPANVMRIVAREREQQDESLSAEWARLDELLGSADRPDTLIALREGVQGRTEELCQRIRAGEADPGPFRDQVMAHVRQTVRDKL